MITIEEYKFLDQLRSIAEKTTEGTVNITPEQAVTLVNVIDDLESEISYLKSYLEIE